MPLIRPFRGLRPQTSYTEAVIAPPYDVLNTEEARARATGRPWSFLHISRPEIDLPANIDPYAAQVYAKGVENLKHMLREGVLKQDEQEVYYVYQLAMGMHVQTGLVAVASVADYDTNRIRKHEFTRPDKEDDRVRQIDALNAQTGPVLLAYKNDKNIDRVLTGIAATPPLVNVNADDGVIHRLWMIDQAKDIEFITRTFDAMPALYIADGHHRSAAASRVAAQRQSMNVRHRGDEAYNYFLAVMFPDTQMRILDYNRVITDLNGLSSEEFLQKIASAFTALPSPKPVKPERPGQFGMFLKDRWYRLNIHAHKLLVDDPVARLDVSLLADHLIAPILGISDPRRDKRIDFVGGIRGLDELEKRVRSGEMAVAFSLYPTPLHDLMKVADANEVMPPKSTWFEPKLADGLVSHLLS
jgi:uncharacterized protein (DUF1015 family)